MDEKIKQVLKHIALVAMDFDGVHTDGYVYVNQEGQEMVRCSRRDSLGLQMLTELGIKLCIISKEHNPVVLARSKKLGIECTQGVESGAGKLEILQNIASRENIPREQVLFIGDDVNDIEALQYAGVAVTVADGHEEIKNVVDIVLARNGGEHALRELCDLIRATRN